jgi:hypothetical protein
MVLASIRKISGKKKLKKLTVKHASPVPFNRIGSVGLMFYLDSEDDLKTVQKIGKSDFLQDKEVHTICWLRTSKKNPHPTIEGTTFVERIDFDSNFLPSSKKTRQFCDLDFDLLIDLTSDYHFPMHAIAVMSNAKLKSGIDHKFNWHLQVRLKPAESKRNNPPYLFEQIISYLERLF